MLLPFSFIFFNMTPSGAIRVENKVERLLAPFGVRHLRCVYVVFFDVYCFYSGNVCHDRAVPKESLLCV